MSELRNRLAKKIEQKEETSDIEEETKIISIKSGELQTMEIVPEFAITLNEAKQRVAMLQNFVREMLVQGIDYGQVPGTKKPSLFKPGAEKLCDIFGFSKQIEVLNRIEDWDKGLFHYEIKVILINKKTGFIESEGLGSCNSREKNTLIRILII